VQNSSLEPIAKQIASLYEGQLNDAESLEAARNLTGFVGLLLEIDRENRNSLDDAV
jgi:hypothetical protein